MNYRLTAGVLLFSLLITTTRLLAQTVDTTQRYGAKSSSASGQFRTWSVGLNGGITTTYTIISDNKTQDFTSPDIQYSYSAYIKNQITNSFSLQADFMTGKLRADHSQERYPNKAYIYSSFNTKLNWSASLSGNLIVAHLGIVQPYLTLGGGLLNYTSHLYAYPNLHKLYNPNTSSGFFVPAGVGLKFDLATGVSLDLGYQINFVNSDDLDGYVYGSNNDKFSYTHIGLEFALGKSSKPQLATQGKHKSRNGEYIPWTKNAKVLAQPVVIKPTPAQQIQVDSTQIKHDQLKRDLDSTNARLARLSVDSDGDGVPDAKDKCPNTPPGTKVDSVGCPLPVAFVETNPEVTTSVADEDKTAVKADILNLEFFPGTSIIHSYSLNGLDKVADLLKKKKIRLRLEGYTDNTGNASENLKLSKERADAVKLYLVGRGVKSAQIETVGYGSANPIASNKTASGRRLNRRVEFILL